MASGQSPIDPAAWPWRECILADRRITTADASEVLGVAVNTARRYLTVLADAGCLVAVRKSARDPHGYWALADAPVSDQ